MASATAASIRMYRHGLGDCFLVALPRVGVKPYYIMIDCGVILGTSDAAQKMQNVVEDLRVTTGGTIDLLVATHEHWDHLSGFVQARDLIKQITVGEVWLPWTENPKDKMAKQIMAYRERTRAALQVAVSRLRLLGAAEPAADIESFLSFFGATGENTTSEALRVVRKLSLNVRYREPADPPYSVEGTGATIYVLGPGRDKKMLERAGPTSSSKETYGMADVTSIEASDMPPFHPSQTIPMSVARGTEFFAKYYWTSAGFGAVDDGDWRRIDGAALETIASDLALRLDNNTNNTSLVIAIELENGGVLLFPGDAQVENWLTWQDASWKIGEKNVTGPELLRRCVFYKVGHHGSHNATLKAKGLETMTRLQAAMIPVDHEMAIKKRWNRMPLPALIKALEEKAHAVIRADAELPRESTAVDGKGLYYEIDIEARKPAKPLMVHR